MRNAVVYVKLLAVTGVTSALVGLVWTAQSWWVLLVIACALLAMALAMWTELEAALQRNTIRPTQGFILETLNEALLVVEIACSRRTCAADLNKRVVVVMERIAAAQRNDAQQQPQGNEQHA